MYTLCSLPDSHVSTLFCITSWEEAWEWDYIVPYCHHSWILAIVLVKYVTECNHICSSEIDPESGSETTMFDTFVVIQVSVIRLQEISMDFADICKSGWDLCYWCTCKGCSDFSSSALLTCHLGKPRWISKLINNFKSVTNLSGGPRLLISWALIAKRPVYLQAVKLC